MAKIYKQITDLIGKTPLVELGKYSASKGLETIYGHLSKQLVTEGRG